MFYVYILKSSKTGQYYTGSCGNLEDRLKEHNFNQTRSTRRKGPYELIYKEEFNTKRDALKREKQIKSFKGGSAFKKLTLVPIV